MNSRLPVLLLGVAVVALWEATQWSGALGSSLWTWGSIRAGSGVAPRSKPDTKHPIARFFGPIWALSHAQPTRSPKPAKPTHHHDVKTANQTRPPQQGGDKAAEKTR